MRAIPIVVLIAVLGTTSACGTDEDGATDGATDGPSGTTQAAEPETFDASGVFVLHGTGDETYGWNRNGSHCEGQGAYSDIVEGAQVLITSSTGEAIALGALGPGTTVEDDAWYQCHFEFAVDDVPVDGAIYGVEVAGRGSVPFSIDDADDLAVELGG